MEVGTPERSCLGVLLAAGEGTRMRSDTPKPLHEVAGRSMLGHALAALVEAGCDRIAVVVGPGAGGEALAKAAQALAPDCEIHVQAERRGTAHAVLAARPALERASGDVLVHYADTPLLTAETLRRLREGLTGETAVVALGFEARDPTGYGRFLERDGRLVAIREHKDASEQERAIRRCNAGTVALAGAHALALLDAVGCDNAAREFYLTDCVGLAGERGLAARAVIGDEEEVMGVNDRVQLAAAEAVMQRRLRERAMRAGATMIAPETVFLSYDTEIGRDVTIEPHVIFSRGCRVEDGALVRGFSHFEGARIGAGATVGPFARLRPGADIGEKAHVGNFVEVKNSRLETGVKANHLSYIGDARVGAATNIGAGTITCNYDGFHKHKTEIGAGVFIGSNTALVAPVKIGDGAMTAAGSVVTRNVASDALALARAPQGEKPGWAKAFRAAHKKP